MLQNKIISLATKFAKFYRIAVKNIEQWNPIWFSNFELSY